MSEDLDEFAEHPLAYSIDNAILMHRDAHFSGDFEIMLDYYRKGGRGVCREFEEGRIAELAKIENESRQNLAATTLSGSEAEQVAQSRQAYKSLRDLYEIKNPKSKLPLLIADLILAEEDVEQAVQAVVEQKSAIVPLLIDLLRNQDFYDPLYPGYGLAPVLAAECLGKIGDKRALFALFEAIGGDDFFNEDVILDALKVIGKPAQDFLLQVLQGLPLNQDNERAAVALVAFRDKPEVAEACLNMLKKIDLVKQAPLATYLVLACENLQGEEQRKSLLSLHDYVGTPKSLKQDIKSIMKTWQ